MYGGEWLTIIWQQCMGMNSRTPDYHMAEVYGDKLLITRWQQCMGDKLLITRWQQCMACTTNYQIACLGLVWKEGLYKHPDYLILSSLIMLSGITVIHSLIFFPNWV